MGSVGLVSEQPMPKWVYRAVVVFWLGFLMALVVRELFGMVSGFMLLLLVSLFLALAIEPGVNWLQRRGWRRGSGTGAILFGVLIAAGIFVGAIGSLVASQAADVLSNSETYVNDTVDFINDTFGTNIDPAEVNVEISDPSGAVQQFINRQQSRVFSLSVNVLTALLQLFSVLLFTFYLVADGPRLRRVICSRLEPDRQRAVLNTWNLAIDKTGGYLYSRALLAVISSFIHWVAFQSIGIPAPIAMAVWVGIVSQFIPVLGTYLAGILPVVLTFPRIAAAGPRRDRVHRGVSAGGELSRCTAHYRAHTAGARSGCVWVGNSWCGDLGPDRRNLGATRFRDDPVSRGQLGRAPRCD
jgi:predicted PurR-regulated permease PerM